MSRLTEGSACFMFCAGEREELGEDCSFYEVCFERQMYDKLKHYEDLEEAGRLIEVVRCKDCDHYNTYVCNEGAGWCEVFEIGRFDNGYCDNAKLKELDMKQKGGAE